MRRFFLFCALVALSLPAAAQQLPIKDFTLKNGMKVIVQEDHTIPNVALYTFYRIGSRNERTGATGMSHFFEHMMFNGAKKYGPGEFDKAMEGNGGSNNAYTNKDTTVYQDWFPKSALELIFDLEADRIQNLSFDPAKIQSERGVVASERRLRTDNSNFGLLNEQLWATAFEAHPYHWPVVGWMTDINAWTIDDLKQHFRVGYSPSNATMVVVGDVTADEIQRLAEKYIEPIPSHEPPAKVVSQEPPQIGERRTEVKKFAQVPIVMIAYHVPRTNDPDYYALQVLRVVLFNGESSRMYQRLVDKDQLALDIGGGSGTALDPTLFTITAQAKTGVAPEKLEAAVYDELQKMQSQPITDEELQKAKNILLANFYRQQKTISGKANSIGVYEVFFGDYHKMFTAPEEYNKVTAADVQRVANKYFIERNRTVATLIPDKNANVPPAPGAAKPEKPAATNSPQPGATPSSTAPHPAPAPSTTTVPKGGVQ